MILNHMSVNKSRIVANSSMHDVKYIGKDPLYIESVPCVSHWFEDFLKMFLHLIIVLDTPIQHVIV